MFWPYRNRVRRTPAIAGASNENLRKAVALAMACLIPLGAGASPAKASRAYENGQFQNAIAEYQKLLQQKTNDARLLFNAGDAAYRAQQFDQAQRYFSQAVLSPDLPLQEGSFYNLGNTLFQMGEPETDLEKKQK